MNYSEFIDAKLQYSGQSGFTEPWLPPFLFDFQRAITEWTCRKGRAAVFADCGMGKTPIQLVWAENIVRRTNKPVLVLAPLATAPQTVREAEKFSIEAERSRDGKIRSGARVVVTNYERLHLFEPTAFAGIVCDESSILKNFDGVTKAAVTEFARRLPYRLLCTATAAPNDYIELGTSAEAIGELGYTDMLTRFFKNDESSIEPMSHSSKWRFKPHAERPFWRWLCSWARALRKPSDLGFDDGTFVLPALITKVTTVDASRPLSGKLFVTPASNLQEQRAERRATIKERCEAVAKLVKPREPFIAWCHLNDEGDLLEQLIPGDVQVSGSDPDERKEEIFESFTAGKIRALVTKPKIGAFGMNWQHCAHMSFFPSHSYEQYYQAVRRCWRYGQTQKVVVDVVTTAGESDVMSNLQRKSDAAARMFEAMVEEMQQELGVTRRIHQSQPVPVPAWMQEVAWTRS